jgi:polar amino acid transport system substrate-binding protein
MVSTRALRGLTLAAIITIIGAGCSGGTPSSASAPAPASASGSGGVGSSPGPNVAAILKKGFILIGTSPDFPPYESVDPSGKIVGFDVDMMDEIAKRMGVTLKWQDMPFDVTIASLQQGKVDISVSTHQKTPDNSKQVDFTDEYEPATTVFMQRNDEDIKMSKPEDAAAYTVGVQTGGTNEKWLQDHLVTPGLMPAANLKTYERADDALLDLLNGRLQLITSEGNTGAVYMRDKPVKFALITTKMNASNYVVAVPKGWDDLREVFNRHIADMKADGTLKRLEEKWNLVEPPPGA